MHILHIYVQILNYFVIHFFHEVPFSQKNSSFSTTISVDFTLVSFHLNQVAVFFYLFIREKFKNSTFIR